MIVLMLIFVFFLHGSTRTADDGRLVKAEWDAQMLKMYLQQWRQRMDEKKVSLRHSGEQEVPYDPGTPFTQNTIEEHSAARAAQMRSPKTGRRSLEK